MGIESLGSYYLNEARLGAGSLGTPSRSLDAAGDAAPGEASFAALLDRARGEAAAASPAPGQNPAQNHGPAPSQNPAPGGGSGPAASGKVRVDKTDKLYEQCEALETFLVKTLITGMRNTVQKTDFLDGGFAGKIYEDMLYDEYAKDFSKNAGFGLAELAYLELTGQRGKLLADHA